MSSPRALIPPPGTDEADDKDLLGLFETHKVPKDQQSALARAMRQDPLGVKTILQDLQIDPAGKEQLYQRSIDLRLSQRRLGTGGLTPPPESKGGGWADPIDIKDTVRRLVTPSTIFATPPSGRWSTAVNRLYGGAAEIIPSAEAGAGSLYEAVTHPIDVGLPLLGAGLQKLSQAAIDKAMSVIPVAVDSFKPPDMTEGGKHLRNNILVKHAAQISNDLRNTFQVNPEYADSFTTTLAEATGSMVAFAGASALTGGIGAPAWVGAAGLGGLSTAGSELQQAIEQGAPDDQLVNIWASNFVVGTSEGWPIGRALNKVNRVSNGWLRKYLGGRVAKLGAHALEGALEEGGQEFFQNTSSNLIAATTYDEKRGVFNSVADQTLAGGLLGAAMNVITASIGLKAAYARRRRYKEYLASKPEAADKNIEQGLEDEVAQMEMKLQQSESQLDQKEKEAREARGESDAPAMAEPQMSPKADTPTVGDTTTPGQAAQVPAAARRPDPESTKQTAPQVAALRDGRRNIALFTEGSFVPPRPNDVTEINRTTQDGQNISFWVRADEADVRTIEIDAAIRNDTWWKFTGAQTRSGDETSVVVQAVDPNTADEIHSIMTTRNGEEIQTVSDRLQMWYPDAKILTWGESYLPHILHDRATSVNADRSSAAASPGSVQIVQPVRLPSELEAAAAAKAEPAIVKAFEETEIKPEAGDEWSPERAKGGYVVTVSTKPGKMKAFQAKLYELMGLQLGYKDTKTGEIVPGILSDIGYDPETNTIRTITDPHRVVGPAGTGTWDGVEPNFRVEFDKSVPLENVREWAAALGAGFGQQAVAIVSPNSKGKQFRMLVYRKADGSRFRFAEQEKLNASGLVFESNNDHTALRIIDYEGKGRDFVYTALDAIKRAGIDGRLSAAATDSHLVWESDYGRILRGDERVSRGLGHTDPTGQRSHILRGAVRHFASTYQRYYEGVGESHISRAEEYFRISRPDEIATFNERADAEGADTLGSEIDTGPEQARSDLAARTLDPPPGQGPGGELGGPLPVSDRGPAGKPELTKPEGGKPRLTLPAGMTIDGLAFLERTRKEPKVEGAKNSNPVTGQPTVKLFDKGPKGADGLALREDIGRMPAAGRLFDILFPIHRRIVEALEAREGNPQIFSRSWLSGFLCDYATAGVRFDGTAIGGFGKPSPIYVNWLNSLGNAYTLLKTGAKAGPKKDKIVASESDAIDYASQDIVNSLLHEIVHEAWEADDMFFERRMDEAEDGIRPVLDAAAAEIAEFFRSDDFSNLREMSGALKIWQAHRAKDTGKEKVSIPKAHAGVPAARKDSPISPTATFNNPPYYSKMRRVVAQRMPDFMREIPPSEKKIGEDKPGFWKENPKTGEKIWIPPKKSRVESRPAQSLFNQIRGILISNGVKAEEIRWSGLEDFLSMRQEVTRQQILSHLDTVYPFIEVEYRKRGPLVNQPLFENLEAKPYLVEQFKRQRESLREKILEVAKAQLAIEGNVWAPAFSGLEDLVDSLEIEIKKGDALDQSAEARYARALFTLKSTLTGEWEGYKFWKGKSEEDAARQTLLEAIRANYFDLVGAYTAEYGITVPTDQGLGISSSPAEGDSTILRLEKKFSELSGLPPHPRQRNQYGSTLLPPVDIGELWIDMSVAANEQHPEYKAPAAKRVIELNEDGRLVIGKYLNALSALRVLSQVSPATQPGSEVLPPPPTIEPSSSAMQTAEYDRYTLFNSPQYANMMFYFRPRARQITDKIQKIYDRMNGVFREQYKNTGPDAPVGPKVVVPGLKEDIRLGRTQYMSEPNAIAIWKCEGGYSPSQIWSFSWTGDSSSPDLMKDVQTDIENNWRAIKDAFGEFAAEVDLAVRHGADRDGVRGWIERNDVKFIAAVHEERKMRGETGYEPYWTAQEMWHALLEGWKYPDGHPFKYRNEVIRSAMERTRTYIMRASTLMEMVDGVIEAEAQPERLKKSEEAFTSLVHGITEAARTVLVDGETRGKLIRRLSVFLSGSTGWDAPHFDDARDMLAHARLDVMPTTDGKTMLVIEEVQSDLHQLGRDFGYTQDFYAKADTRAERALNVLERLDRLGYSPHDAATLNKIFDESEADAKAAEDIRGTHPLRNIHNVPAFVPEAPFEKNWHELVMNRLMRWAAEMGFDGIAWTSGEVQDARYPTRGKVRPIKWERNPDGTYNMPDCMGHNLRHLTERDLKMLVGSAGLNAIKSTFLDAGTLTAEQIDKRGAGMRKWYGSIPNSEPKKAMKVRNAKYFIKARGVIGDYVQKMAGPYGGKVQVVNVNRGTLTVFGYQPGTQSTVQREVHGALPISGKMDYTAGEVRGMMLDIVPELGSSFTRGFPSEREFGRLVGVAFYEHGGYSTARIGSRGKIKRWIRTSQRWVATDLYRILKRMLEGNVDFKEALVSLPQVITTETERHLGIEKGTTAGSYTVNDVQPMLGMEFTPEFVERTSEGFALFKKREDLSRGRADLEALQHIPLPEGWSFRIASVNDLQVRAKGEGSSDSSSVIDRVGREVLIPAETTTGQMLDIASHQAAHASMMGSDEYYDLAGDILQNVRQALQGNEDADQIRARGLHPATVKHIQEFLKQSPPDIVLLEEAYAAELGYRYRDDALANALGDPNVHVDEDPDAPPTKKTPVRDGGLRVLGQTKQQKIDFIKNHGSDVVARRQRIISRNVSDAALAPPPASVVEEFAYPSVEYVSSAIKDGDAIATPFLQVEWNDQAKEWRIDGHEGRARMMAIAMRDPSTPIPVHVFPWGKRSRNITPEMAGAPIRSDVAAPDPDRTISAEHVVLNNRPVKGVPPVVHTRGQYEISGVRFDNESGIGEVPNNRNVDYLGFVVYLTPRQFLDLSPVKPLFGLEKRGDVGNYKEKFLGKKVNLSRFLEQAAPDEEIGWFVTPDGTVYDVEGEIHGEALDTAYGGKPDENGEWAADYGGAWHDRMKERGLLRISRVATPNFGSMNMEIHAMPTEDQLAVAGRLRAKFRLDRLYFEMCWGYGNQQYTAENWNLALRLLRNSEFWTADDKLGIIFEVERQGFSQAKYRPIDEKHPFVEKKLGERVNLSKFLESADVDDIGFGAFIMPNGNVYDVGFQTHGARLSSAFGEKISAFPARFQALVANGEYEELWHGRLSSKGIIRVARAAAHPGISPWGDLLEMEARATHTGELDIEAHSRPSQEQLEALAAIQRKFKGDQLVASVHYGPDPGANVRMARWSDFVRLSNREDVWTDVDRMQAVAHASRDYMQYQGLGLRKTHERIKDVWGFDPELDVDKLGKEISAQDLLASDRSIQGFILRDGSIRHFGDDIHADVLARALGLGRKSVKRKGWDRDLTAMEKYSVMMSDTGLVRLIYYSPSSRYGGDTIAEMHTAPSPDQVEALRTLSVRPDQVISVDMFGYYGNCTHADRWVDVLRGLNDPATWDDQQHFGFRRVGMDLTGLRKVHAMPLPESKEHRKIMKEIRHMITGSGLVSEAKAWDVFKVAHPDVYTRDQFKSLWKQSIYWAAQAIPDMTESELNEIGRSAKNLKNFMDALDRVPDVNILKVLGKAGELEKGWYARAVEGLRILTDMIAPEYRTEFTRLLAALSPQQPVKENILMALRIFNDWKESGFSKDEKFLREKLITASMFVKEAVVDKITGYPIVDPKTGKPKIKSKVMRDPWGRVLKTRNRDGELVPLQVRVPGTPVGTVDIPARVENSISALLGRPFTKNSPKVSSFSLNMLGHRLENIMAATLDTHMAKLILGAGNVQRILGERPYYIAYSTRLRRAARELGWNPRELQETSWSVIKALWEMSAPVKGVKGPTMPSWHIDELTRELVAAHQAEFAKLLLEDPDVKAKLVSYGIDVRTLEAQARAAGLFESPRLEPWKAEGDDLKMLRRAGELIDAKRAGLRGPALAKAKRAYQEIKQREARINQTERPDASGLGGVRAETAAPVEEVQPVGLTPPAELKGLKKEGTLKLVPPRETAGEEERKLPTIQHVIEASGKIRTIVRPNLPPPPGLKGLERVAPPPPAGRTGQELLDWSAEVMKYQPPKSESLMDWIKRQPRDLQRKLVAQFGPLDDYEGSVFAKAGVPRPTHRISRAFELVAGAAAKAERDAVMFKRVLEPIFDKIGDFEQYLFWKRLESRLRTDREQAARDPNYKPHRKFGTATEAEANLALSHLESLVGPEWMKKFDQAAHNYQLVMNKALLLQVEAGRMTAQDYMQIKLMNDFYAPYHVIKEIEQETIDGLNAGGSKVATRAPLTHRIKGMSDDDVHIRNIIQESFQLVQRSRILAEKNMVMVRLGELAAMDALYGSPTDPRLIEKIRGMIFVPPKAPGDMGHWVMPGGKPIPPGFGVLPYFENGERVNLVTTSSLVQAVQGINAIHADALKQILSSGAKTLRVGATTANVGFQVVNILLSDMPRLALMSKYGIQNPLDAVRMFIDAAHGFYSAASAAIGKPNPLYMQALQSGALNSTIARQLDPEAFSVELGLPPPPGAKPTARIKRIGVKTLHTISKIANVLEETTKVTGVKRGWRIEGLDRMPLAQRAAKMAEMATEIRNYAGSPDFARKGLYGRDASLLFMFFNANLQGAAADISRLTGRRGETREAKAAWLKIALTIVLPILANALRNEDDEYKEDWALVSDQEKENHFMIARDKFFYDERGNKIREYWRIPKRGFIKVLGNILEGFAKIAHQFDPETSDGVWGALFESSKKLDSIMWDAARDLLPISLRGDSLGEYAESIGSSLNPLIKVPAELISGYDFWRRRQIVPEYMKDAAASEQYRTNTPGLYRELGELTNTSPLKWQHAAEGLTGNAAGNITPLLGAAGIGPLKEKPLPGRSVLTTVPPFKRFVRSAYLENKTEIEALRKAEEGEATDSLRRRRKAELLMSDWRQQGLSPSQMLSEARRLRRSDPMLYNRVKANIEDEKRGMTYFDRRIKALSVGDGSRARYVYERLQRLEDQTDKRAYLKDLKRKRLITPEVDKQLRRLEKGLDAIPGRELPAPP